MAKYDPLRRYLRRQSCSELTLTFGEIETLVNGILPKRARNPDWWGNGQDAPPTPVQHAAWLEAGYQAFPVVTRELVVFRRIASCA